MRNLLRMSLFIIARAGLCLAVVAWLLGPWWMVKAVVNSASMCCWVHIRETDWGISYGSSNTQSFFVRTLTCLRPYTSDDGTYDVFTSSSHPVPADESERPISDGGTYLSFMKPFAAFSHRLTVTAFVVLNIVLQFVVYRRRREDKPCESDSGGGG